MANQAKQGNKTSKKARKDKKWKSYQAKQDWQGDRTLVSKTNIFSAKKKIGQNWDVFKITCYNCNKKSYYVSNYIELKAKK